MSGFKYERYETRRTNGPATRNRSIFGWWMPVAVTVTLAAGGLVAWALRARDDYEHSTEEEDDALSYGGDTDKEGHHRPGPGPGPGSRPPSYGVSGGVAGGVEQQTTQETTTTTETRTEDNTILGRVQGVIRRTPSPQQIFDGASKKVAAGMAVAGAAAGAVMGGALGSIREDGEDDFADHERWKQSSAVGSGVGSASGTRSTFSGKRETVAIVLSADEGDIPIEEEDDKGYSNEEASLLSHIPAVDANAVNLVILIYAPRNQQHDSKTSGAVNPNAPSSLASSYSAIPTPGEELSTLEPMPVTPALSARSSGSSYYDMLYRQASRLVSNPVAIMPFATPTGHVHMLKHIGPKVVYVAESLSGSQGQNIEAIREWVGQIVIVVGGDAAGLVDDTEDEVGTGTDTKKKWWDGSDMIGLGKRVEVVDAARVEDDWQKRIAGKE